MRAIMKGTPQHFTLYFFWYFFQPFYYIRLIFWFSQTFLFFQSMVVFSLIFFSYGYSNSYNNFMTTVWGICVSDQRLTTCCLEKMHLLHRWFWGAKWERKKKNQKEEGSYFKEEWKLIFKWPLNIISGWKFPLKPKCSHICPVSAAKWFCSVEG